MNKNNNIFTIGDKVYTKDLNYVSTIEKFVPNNSVIGGMEVWLTSPNGKAMQALGHLKHAKKPLFTTEDGVDIFEGESYYELITPDFHNKPCIWNILPTKTRGNINYDQEGNRRNGRIWFSTKEKAEDYILMNKPCLSMKEVLNCREAWFKSTMATKDELVKLVRSKLNK